MHHCLPSRQGKLVIPRVALGRAAAQKLPRVDGRAPKARSPSSHHVHLPLSSSSFTLTFRTAQNSLSNRHQMCLIPESSRRCAHRRVSVYNSITSLAPTLNLRPRLLLEFSTYSVLSWACFYWVNYTIQASLSLLPYA